MKKLMIFLAALMLLTTIAVPAFAADTEVTITASSDLVQLGDEVIITVAVSGDVPYSMLGVRLAYDEQVFELVSSEVAQVGIIQDFDPATKALSVAFAEESAFAGELLKLKLKVKVDAPRGATDIKGTISSAVTATVKNAKITIECNHDFTWTSADDAHTGTCSVCGEEKTEAHTWADKSVDKKPATCTKPGSETYKCSVCDATKTVELEATGHTWDNACDAQCNNGCGTTREVSHKYSDKWSADEKGHWNACTVCGDKKDAGAHIPGEAATEKNPQKCTVCDYVVQPALKHVHDFDTSIWQQDSENHWHVCKKPSCAAWGSTAPHDYDDECDVSCNTCSHVRIAPHHFGTEWQGRIHGHWLVCVLCGEQSSIMPHIPGDPATEDTPQVCTECQYWIQYPLSHEHSYDMTWGADDYNHWKSCVECGATTEQLPHSWDEGTIRVQATETTNGEIDYTCKDCGVERTVLILATGTQTDPTGQTDSTEQTDPTEQTEPDDTRPQITPPGEKEEFPWWILIVAAVTLLLTGIVLFVVEFIRSRRHNMHGKFSK